VNTAIANYHALTENDIGQKRGLGQPVLPVEGMIPFAATVEYVAA